MFYFVFELLAPYFSTPKKVPKDPAGFLKYLESEYRIYGFEEQVRAHRVAYKISSFPNTLTYSLKKIGVIGNYQGCPERGGSNAPQSWKILFFLVVNFKNLVKNLRKFMKILKKHRLLPPIFENLSENLENFSKNFLNS
jgi:hypothetical protein